ncbi:hypothetical protein ASZ90_011739 [hydrocarbon metagenome]|uniref:Uncharacterized protein n=1 Tax=hydrocarbon metagenome TaxID=938273 RepID=A0A0W8FCB9_9ZZZZ
MSAFSMLQFLLFKYLPSDSNSCKSFVVMLLRYQGSISSV